MNNNSQNQGKPSRAPGEAGKDEREKAHSDGGTVAGRGASISPVNREAANDESGAVPAGSPGAMQDREQAKEGKG